VSVAFYLILILGLLSMIAIPWSPEALVQGPLFLITAWGIRRRRAWSAYGLAILLFVLTAVPLVSILIQGTQQAAQLISAGVFALAIVILLFFAGRAIEAVHGRHGLAWPWIGASALLGGFFLLFGLYQMPTGSMENTLLVGDRIAVLRTHGRSPERGELVTHYYPVNRKQIFVKRIVAIPGDRVQIRNKQLFVNGSPVSESYVAHKTDTTESYRDNFPGNPNVPLYPQATEMLEKNVQHGEVVVPPGRYFVLGDNRDMSLDSRYWGFIDASDIIGTPKFVYYSATPPDKRLPIQTVRWNRIFHALS
jgi:signal peptidase I